VTDQEETPNVLADFQCDALGRRIEKLGRRGGLARCGGVASATTTRHYLHGQRIVEETENRKRGIISAIVGTFAAE